MNKFLNNQPPFLDTRCSCEAVEFHPLTVCLLRMLVANDRRRIEEISAAMADMDAADLTPAWMAKCQAAHARLDAHEQHLADILYPAAPLAGSAVSPLVISAAQPGNIF